MSDQCRVPPEDILTTFSSRFGLLEALAADVLENERHGLTADDPGLRPDIARAVLILADDLRIASDMLNRELIRLRLQIPVSLDE